MDNEKLKLLLEEICKIQKNTDAKILINHLFSEWCMFATTKILKHLGIENEVRIDWKYFTKTIVNSIVENRVSMMQNLPEENREDSVDAEQIRIIVTQVLKKVNESIEQHSQGDYDGSKEE